MPRTSVPRVNTQYSMANLRYGCEAVKPLFSRWNPVDLPARAPGAPPVAEDQAVLSTPFSLGISYGAGGVGKTPGKEGGRRWTRNSEAGGQIASSTWHAAQFLK
jgi:hypothetical protein